MNEANLKAFYRYERLLVLKNYSNSTQKTYLNEFHLLLRLLGSVPVNSLTKENLLSYLMWLYKKKGYSEAHLHTTINALKFYFEKVEGRPREFYDLPRPKKPFKLPTVLAEQEIIALIQSASNLKHKALLMTAYSAGLGQ